MARGRRVELGPAFKLEDMRRGDYCRPAPIVDPMNHETWWIFITPSGNKGRINPEWHRVLEYPNGTITVDPSIHFEGEGCDWLLTRGIWRAVRRPRGP
jgi:hypothetical protein